MTDTLLLMIGRGSHDASANAEAWQFARLRWEAEPVGWLEIGYAAMTEPSLGERCRSFRACRSVGWWCSPICCFRAS